MEKTKNALTHKYRKENTILSDNMHQNIEPGKGWENVRQGLTVRGNDTWELTSLAMWMFGGRASYEGGAATSHAWPGNMAKLVWCERRGGQKE